MKRGSSSLLFALLGALLTSFASTTSLNLEESFSEEVVYRLPTAVSPNHYDIELVPYFTDGSFVFTGQVTINVTISSLTNVIIVHNQNLRVDQSATTVTSEIDGSLLDIVSQTYDSIRHFYILSFDRNLPFGNYIVFFNYAGDLLTDMYGLYRSSYEIGDETRWLVSTQFQATSARRAFLCFDEPGFKATFNVRLAHFTNQTALSNMPSISTSAPDTTIGGRVWTQFETTPIMSTYIMAFIISDFESVRSTDQFFGLWSRSEAISTTSWALEATQRLYPIFLETVQHPDPWPKIDQVAVPDFSAGAMENWGLITYRERLILWEEGESNSRARERIGAIISHELAHIWFGNLVSPVWWNHLWFNEGFATLFEYNIPAIAYPEWRFTERFITEHQLPALLADSLETTRAMTSVVGSPSSVSATFDTVAYSKSGSILNMLRRVLTEEHFSTALGTFLNESAHGTFEPANLWAHAQAVADATDTVQNHIPIAAFMDSWVTQPGYPLVTVSRNYSTTVVVFSQERFYRNPSSPTADPESNSWWIPITFATSNNVARCNEWVQPDWLRAQDKAIMMAGFSNDSWIIAHCQGIGFYRTNYDTRNWEMLTEFLRGSSFTQLNAINRAILIDDSFNLARAGYIDYSIPLNLSTYLTQETDFVVWRTTITPFTYLNTILASDASISIWHSYQQSLISHLYESLGWNPGTTDTHEVRLHRQQILTLACEVNLPGARAIAEAQFNTWIANPQLNPVDPDLRSIVYCWGARHASEEIWDIMWDRFVSTKLATEEDLLIQSLACSQNTTILEKYLLLSIQPNSGIRMQDTRTVFTSILTNGADTVDMLLDFLAVNGDAVAEFYSGFNTIASMLTSISARITRQDQLDKFQDVANSAGLSTSTAIQGGIQAATANLQWISNNGPEILSWLQDQGLEYETTTVTVTSTTEDTSGATALKSSLFFTFVSLFLCTRILNM